MPDDAQLKEHLKVLDYVQLQKGIDYETLGKIALASLFRSSEEQIATQQPNSEGHMQVEGQLRYAIKFHAERRAEIQPFLYDICCICSTDGGGIIICRGNCCPGGPRF